MTYLAPLAPLVLMTRLIRAESYRLLVTRLRPSTLPIRPPSSVVDLVGPADAAQAPADRKSVV